jgi:hypothetical protein
LPFGASAGCRTFARESDAGAFEVLAVGKGEGGKGCAKVDLVESHVTVRATL